MFMFILSGIQYCVLFFFTQLHMHGINYFVEFAEGLNNALYI